MKITSPAFRDGKTIPAIYTCDGDDRLPPLEFADIPVDSVSLALILEDPDTSKGTFDHWVVYNIDPSTRVIEEGIEPQGISGMNDTGKTGYAGPCPPTGVHHYIFTLIALDSKLDLPEGSSKKTVLDAAEGHIIDKAKLVGLYSKK